MDRRAILAPDPDPPARSPLPIPPPTDHTAAEPPALLTESASSSHISYPTSHVPPSSSLIPHPASLSPPCANCDSPLAGPYCSQCGQHVADYHRSLWRLVADFFDNTFCWDNKLFRTFGPLLRRPGLLTREFMAGRRVRYVHPLRLFLFTSAVCLTVLQFGHHGLIKVNKTAKSARRGLTFQLNGDGSPAPDGTPGASPSPSTTDGTATPAIPTASAFPANEDDSPAPSSPGTSLAPDGLDARIEREVKSKITRLGGEDQLTRAISEGVQQRLSWVALALLPVFALALRALYWQRDSFYFAHLVFSLHYHTFLLLFAVGFSWLGVLLHGWTGWFLLAPPVYLYLSLRQVYGGSARRTVAKVLLLGSMHLLIILLGLAAVGALAFFSAGK